MRKNKNKKKRAEPSCLVDQLGKDTYCKVDLGFKKRLGERNLKEEATLGFGYGRGAAREDDIEEAGESLPGSKFWWRTESKWSSFLVARDRGGDLKRVGRGRARHWRSRRGR